MDSILKEALEQIVDAQPVIGNWQSTSEKLKGYARRALLESKLEDIREIGRAARLRMARTKIKKQRERINVLKAKIAELKERIETSGTKTERKARLGHNTHEIKKMLGNIRDMATAPNSDKEALLSWIHTDAVNALKILGE